MAVISRSLAGRTPSGAGVAPHAFTYLGGLPHDVARTRAPRREHQPPSPGARLALDATLAKFERQANDRLADAEARLLPAEAYGFADRFARDIDDLSARSLADLPASLRPGAADGLATVRALVIGRAREYGALAGGVDVFNTATRLLDDIGAGVGHDPAAFGVIRERGLAAVDAMPIGGEARAHLSKVFLADLPVRLAEAHIAHDPEDAARALGSGSADYDGLAADLRARFAVRAQTEAARRRDESDRALVARLERAIDDNRIGADGIEAEALGPHDRERLLRRLEERVSEEARRAAIVDGYMNRTDSYDPGSSDDREKVGILLGALGVTLDSLADTDKEAAALIRQVADRTGIVPDEIAGELARLVEEGTDEQQDFAIALAAGLLPHVPDPSSDAEAVPAPEESSAPVQAPAPEDDTESDWWGRWGVEALDLVTDFIPVVSEVKAAGQLAYLAYRFKQALERGDRRAAFEIGTQMAVAAADLAPGPNLAGVTAKVAKISKALPAVPGARRAGGRDKASSPDGPGGADEAARELKDRQREQLNKSVGTSAIHERRGLRHLRRMFGHGQPQITIVTKNGYRMRVDAAVRRRDGKIFFVEFKSGDGVLERQQPMAVRDMRENGGWIVGKGKEGVEGVTELGPTHVRVIYQGRPELNERNMAKAAGRKEKPNGTGRRKRR